ncbi:MAG: hypothetical protein CME06_05440 [Gemmatimonadetes bacterium]|nr:hypothetical protein [Gemmatimonadota bacterium]
MKFAPGDQGPASVPATAGSASAALSRSESNHSFIQGGLLGLMNNSGGLLGLMNNNGQLDAMSGTNGESLPSLETTGGQGHISIVP